MHIRPATSDDIPSLIRLNHEVQQLHVARIPRVFIPADAKAVQEWFFNILGHTDTVILLAVVQDDIAGYLILRKAIRPAYVFAVERRCGYIDHVCIASPFRRKGVFTALLNESEKIAGVWGVDRLELDVWSENPEAKAAFSRCGFETYNERMGRTLR